MLLSVGALNEHLICRLCTGYFREAHTIPECLHTFCRCCLLRELQQPVKGSKKCPSCQTPLGLNAENKCIYDRSLQSCVDRLFPEFAEREAAAFAKEAAADDDSASRDITIRVCPAADVAESERLPPLKKMMLKTHVGIKVAKVQKFIQKRLLLEGVDIDYSHIQISFENELLDPSQDLTGPAQSSRRAGDSMSKVESSDAGERMIFTYQRRKRLESA